MPLRRQSSIVCLRFGRFLFCFAFRPRPVVVVHFILLVFFAALQFTIPFDCDFISQSSFLKSAPNKISSQKAGWERNKLPKVYLQTLTFCRTNRVVRLCIRLYIIFKLTNEFGKFPNKRAQKVAELNAYSQEIISIQPINGKSFSVSSNCRHCD